MRRALAALLLSIIIFSSSFAQSLPSKERLQQMCDSLSVRTKAYFKTEAEIKLRRTRQRAKSLDIYFTREASYFPWHSEDLRWFRSELAKELKLAAPGFTLGHIYAHNTNLDQYLTIAVNNNGEAHNYAHRIADPREDGGRFIRQVGARYFNKGLSDRYIALWQSHGLYYNETQEKWLYQRAPLFRTVEDLYTQSYVLPFLIPMLENAGAYVLTPRERDLNPLEYIMDNDPSFDGERPGMMRRQGLYEEIGAWESAGEGFADYKESYSFSDNPFRAGTARMTTCKAQADASISWIPHIEERGEYAVYISYKSLENSTEEAHYTVRHLGGKTEFIVNQNRGGGTWIYLGSFEFEKDGLAYVSLSNEGPEGKIVSADAVRIGGGMGLLKRNGAVSGVKRYMEGALYSMPWAGVDSTISRAWDTEYVSEYSCRGAWATWMREEKDIPFDLALAFHSDAGKAQCDSTIGTLTIYTSSSEGKTKFDDGRHRKVSRLLCDYVQTEIVNDIRANFNPDWARRGIWDKAYNESRTPGVPAMILELLSHQNANDQRYGLDPAFRFTVCRSVYKGILKTLSDYYGCQYAVQPLPINSFSVRFSKKEGWAQLNWKPTKDPAEPTADPIGYIVYTRIDDGAFDDGVEVHGTNLELPMSEGHIYSYKVVAFNEGGKSFPSEILAIGRPFYPIEHEICIVNNFDRLSAPHWAESEGHAGFDSNIDNGVPYIKDISYIGETFDFDPLSEYVDDINPGFGGSYTNMAGAIIMGNTFDYPYIHGQSLMRLGYPFISMSREAFCQAPVKSGTIDLICGKQSTSINGIGKLESKYSVFTAELIRALKESASQSCNLLISGANIASDQVDNKSVQDFLKDFLGVRLEAIDNSDKEGYPTRLANMPFHNKPNQSFYCVEQPDGLMPNASGAKIWLRYSGTKTPGAISFKGQNHKSISMGIPLECIKKEEDRDFVLGSALQFFCKGGKLTNK